MRDMKKIDDDTFMYIIFGIYVCSLILISTVLPTIFGQLKLIILLIRYVSMVTFVARIALDFKEEKKVSIVMILFLLISIISFRFSCRKSVIWLFLTLMALRKLDIDKLLKIAYYVLLVIFFSTVSLSLLNIIPDWTFNRGSIIRHSLGFIYATDCIGVYLAIVLLYFHRKKSNAPIVGIIILEGINIFLYIYTNGRLSFILITTLLIIMALSKISVLKKILKNEATQKIIKAICYTLPIILFVSYNCLTYAYLNNNNIAKKINELLSNRLEYTAQAYENYKVPIFGKPIRWQGWGGYGYTYKSNFNYNYVDSSYARLIFDFGIIYTILIILAYTYILVNNFNNKNYWNVLTIFYILIWAFIEPYLIDLGRNPLMLLLIPVLDLGMINLNAKKKIERL